MAFAMRRLFHTSRRAPIVSRPVERLAQRTSVDSPRSFAAAGAR
jgi:hypothetical protein